MQTHLLKDLIGICLYAFMQLGCTSGSDEQVLHVSGQPGENAIDTQTLPGNTLRARFTVPEGCVRLPASDGSFAAYLTGLPLKPAGAKVHTYNGQVKEPRGVYCAVIDLPIGKKDLHQCADAVIRLRAEYLWEKGRYADIRFHLTNGFRMDYAEWMQGKRLAVEGNKTYWVDKAQPSNTYEDLWAYLETVFMYAGTLSLQAELDPVPIREMQIGDVFVQGGSPGHAVIVVDMARNTETGATWFMLAQSYMPAQELQILLYPHGSGPWYPLNFGDVLRTPSWTFKSGDLKRF